MHYKANRFVLCGILWLLFLQERGYRKRCNADAPPKNKNKNRSTFSCIVMVMMMQFPSLLLGRFRTSGLMVRTLLF